VRIIAATNGGLKQDVEAGRRRDWGREPPGFRPSLDQDD
jgi:hypothetical protein